MAKVDWPAADKRALIGKRINRADGPVKATGAAKYSYDVNRPGLLYAKLIWSPYARAEVVSVDTGPAAALPGVKAVWKDDALIGKEVNFAGQILAAVAAQTEEIAAEAAQLVKVEYKPLEHQVRMMIRRFLRAIRTNEKTVTWTTRWPKPRWWSMVGTVSR